MSVTTNFTTVDQKDAEGKVLDKIYTITKTETEEKVTNITLSGTEVNYKLQVLEGRKKKAEEDLKVITDEITYLKEMIK